MTTTVVTANHELKAAIKREDSHILIKGTLAKRLKVLARIKGPVLVDHTMGTSAAGAALAVGAGIPVVVAITLIITIGVVVIVAILKDYNVKLKVGDDRELVLDRKQGE
ncbi:hypothetical protein D3C73_877720 [compost metagenome]